MTNHSSISAQVAILALTTFLSFASAQAQTATSSTMQGGMAGSKSAMPANMDMKSMMKGMNDKMASMPMSGDSDADFVSMMRVHHQGAIDMAETELRDGKSPQMRKMAKEIIAAQKKEIAKFDKFLAMHGKMPK
jgi:uncharacterized protein (DUF305 family)